MCKRDVHSVHITIHHYVPKCRGGTLQDTLQLCLTCHSFLHFCIPIDEVDKYDTYEKIADNEKFKTYLKLVEKILHPNIIKVKKLKKILNY
jgi:hypothetical protein